jgi:hypothetical protein
VARIPPTGDEVIITAASASFGRALLALLGSLNLNWPGHPRVVVYDIGLDGETRRRVEGAGYEVRAVERFCPHWRKHYTWKIWCWNDAPAPRFFWLDAGAVVLRPLDEVFRVTATLGYFVIPTYRFLTENASEEACLGCGVAPEFGRGRMTWAAGVIAFDRSHAAIGPLLRTALELAHDEKHLRASAPLHRHDQALISLLLHKHLGDVVCSDGLVYGGWTSPRQVPGQKVWVHRRRMREHDVEHFARHIATGGKPRMPFRPVRPGFFGECLARLECALHRPRDLLLAHRSAYRLCYRVLVGRWPDVPRGPSIHDGVHD